MDSSSENKAAKALKVGNESARRMMKSGKDNMGFKEPKDFGAMEWITFKTDHADVSTACNKMQVNVLCL